MGELNVLVNNAGFHSRGPVADVSAESLAKMIDVNLRAPIYLSRLAIPYLLESSKPAAIINVASLAGRSPIPGAATYSASKFGLRTFTFALGEELRNTNIKLAVVSPGPIDTGFIMSNIDEVADITFSQKMSTDSEVADAIVAACSSGVRELCMPTSGAFLTTINYLFPAVGRAVRPLLERKGAKIKARLKAEMPVASDAEEQ